MHTPYTAGRKSRPAVSLLFLPPDNQLSKEQAGNSYCCTDTNRNPLRLDRQDGQQSCQGRCNRSHTAQCHAESFPTCRLVVGINAASQGKAAGGRAVSLTKGHQAQLEPILFEPTANQEHADNGHQSNDTGHVNQNRCKEISKQFRVQGSGGRANADFQSHAGDVVHSFLIGKTDQMELAHNCPYDSGTHNAVQQSGNLAHNCGHRGNRDLSQISENYFAQPHAQ